MVVEDQSKIQQQQQQQHQQQLMPEEGELVMASVNQISPHGVYVTLDEYNKLPAFLHISEISTGWVRDIERYAKPGQKLVLKVIRINKVRKEIDLSLRQVSGEERRQKIIEVKKNEKARTIFEAIKQKLNLDATASKKLEAKLLEQYDSLYEAFEDIARRGQKAISKIDVPAEYAETLETISKEKISIPIVEVRGIMDIRVKSPDGIEVIRNALVSAEETKSSSAQIKTTYLGTPRYRITVRAENYKIAERALQNAIEKIRSLIEKSKGKFNIVRESSRKQVE
jgi:translation initiation factor 2 subunit 1